MIKTTVSGFSRFFERIGRHKGRSNSASGSSLTPMLLLLAAILAAAVAVVQPQRQFLTQDDGWAYARMVETLLKTGYYQLDQWSAANMPVQIYLGAAFAKMFGYSLALLRWPTLVLFFVALASFNALLFELGLRREGALALTLGLMASPVVLMLAFTFMSDVQFLGWLLLALWLSVRGLRRKSVVLLVLGSLASASAIGTRQFGIAIFGGWALVWFVAAADTRPPVQHLLAATFAPVAAALLQLYGSSHLNATQAYRIAEQHAFLQHPPVAIARELVWRVGVSIQYLSLFLLPLTPLLLGLSWLALRGARFQFRATIIAVACFGLVALALALNSSLTVRPAALSRYGWSNLSLIWVLPTILWSHPKLQQYLALIGFLTSLPIMLILSVRRGSAPRTEELLLWGTGAALFFLQVAYVQFNDTYFVGLVPFGLLWIATKLPVLAPPATLLRASIAVSVVCILSTALWMRVDYDYQEIGWYAADKALAEGWASSQISGPKHWEEYHGAFDDWLRAGSPGLQPPPSQLQIGQDPFHDPFYTWLADRSEQRGDGQAKTR